MDEILVQIKRSSQRQHEKIEFTIIIFENPKRYSSWWYKGKHLSLKLNGSIRSDQNNSSFITCMLDKGNLCLVLNVQLLMQRIVHECKKIFNDQNKIVMSSGRYASSEKRWCKPLDQEAKNF